MYRKYKSSKYRASKVQIDGMTFDSKREYQRWLELLDKQAAGEIVNLERQVIYQLIPRQIGTDGKVWERKVDYVADFVYETADGLKVVEDVKGYRTPEYIIKRKLMLWVHRIRIKEVY